MSLFTFSDDELAQLEDAQFLFESPRGNMPLLNWFDMKVVRPIVGKHVLFKGPAADDPTQTALIYMSGIYNPPHGHGHCWFDALGRPITEFCPTHWVYIDSLER